jgi:glycerol kinase
MRCEEHQGQKRMAMRDRAETPHHIIAIDQGTTLTRTIIFGPDMKVVSSAQQEFPQHFPASGSIEHNPEDLWRTVLATGRAALRKAKLKASHIAAIGITNQRETAIVWVRKSGRAIHNAIVWQDRRTADVCRDLKASGLEKMISRKTGLLLDPYFPPPRSPGSWRVPKARG